MVNDDPDILNENDLDMNQEEKPDKTVHIQLTVYSSESENVNCVEDVNKAIVLTPAMNCKAIRKLLLSEFEITNTGVVLKLRNQRSSIIPLSYSIPENPANRPYTLEVFDRYQNVTPNKRTISVPTYEQVLKRKLQSIDKRLMKLEDYAPMLPDRQLLKVGEEIRDLNDKMNVLDRKLKDADETQWQGMFQRNPLW